VYFTKGSSNILESKSSYYYYFFSENEKKKKKEGYGSFSGEVGIDRQQPLPRYG